MPQFAVHRNKNPHSKATFPFLIDVQSDLLDELNTRVVIPLTRTAGLARKPLSHLTPTLSFEGDTYLLMTPQLAGIARADLGPRAGSLVDQREQIMAAVDFLLTGF